MSLIILCGLPFSGKTTLSKQIEKYTGNRRVSFDELWVEFEKGQKHAGDLIWEFVREEAKKRIANYLKQGESIVYDDTNPKKEHRDDLIKVAQECNAKWQIVYLEVPWKLILKRRAQNLEDKQRHNVEDHNFDLSLDQFEVPSEEENVIVFKIDDDERWLRDKLQSKLIR